jgi:hypothetical protein
LIQLWLARWQEKKKKQKKKHLQNNKRRSILYELIVTWKIFLCAKLCCHPDHQAETDPHKGEFGQSQLIYRSACSTLIQCESQRVFRTGVSLAECAVKNF